MTSHKDGETIDLAEICPPSRAEDTEAGTSHDVHKDDQSVRRGYLTLAARQSPTSGSLTLEKAQIPTL